MEIGTAKPAGPYASATSTPQHMSTFPERLGHPTTRPVEPTTSFETFAGRRTRLLKLINRARRYNEQPALILGPKTRTLTGANGVAALETAPAARAQCTMLGVNWTGHKSGNDVAQQLVPRGGIVCAQAKAIPLLGRKLERLEEPNTPHIANLPGRCSLSRRFRSKI